MPGVAYDYLERGAEDDVMIAANREALANLRCRPRMMGLTGCRNVAAITALLLDRPPIARRLEA